MSITVKTKDEAWKVANSRFPTDYDYDDFKSANAGYSIYWTTIKEGHLNQWISDLGDRLELNYFKDEEFISEFIWIDEDAEEETEATETETKTKEQEELETATEAAKVCEDFGRVAHELNRMALYKAVNLTVSYYGNDRETKAYEALTECPEKYRTHAASTMIQAYCEAQGIEYKCIENITVKEVNGYFFIGAFVQLTW